MKRGVLLFVFLTFLPVVYAQDITLFNQNYPIILVIPLAMIILALLFFLFIYVKDNYSHIKKFSIIPSGSFKILKKRKEKFAKYKPVPMVDYGFELKKFKSRHLKLKTNESFLQFFGIFKDYIRDELNVREEVSLEELRPVVAEKKKKLIPILDSLIRLKYSPHELRKEELENLIGRFDHYLNVHYSRKEITREKSWFKRIIFSRKVSREEITGLSQKKKKSFFRKALEKLHEEYFLSKKIFFSRLTGKGTKKKKIKKPEVKEKKIPQKKFKLKITLFKKIRRGIRHKARKTSGSLVEATKRVARGITFAEKTTSKSIMNAEEGLGKGIESPFNPIKKFREKLEFNRRVSNLNGLLSRAEHLANKDIDKSRKVYSEALAIYYRLPLEIEQDFATRLINVYERLDNNAHERRKKELMNLSKKINKVKKTVAKQHHDFLDSLKFFFDGMKKRIRKTEDLFVDSLGQDISDIPRKLKHIKHSVSKTFNFLDYLKELASNINEKREQKILKLSRMEYDFLDHVHGLLKKIHFRKLKGIFSIKKREQEFLEKSEVLLNYMRDKEKSSEKQSISLEKKIMKKIKELHIPSDIPIPIKSLGISKQIRKINKDLEEIHKKPELMKEKKPILKESVKKLDSFVRLPEIEIPKEEERKVLKRPFKFEKKLIGTKQFKTLNLQEKELSKSLESIEKRGPIAEDFVDKPKINASKKTYLPSWEKKIEKVRHEIPKTLNKLNKEEQEIYKKLDNL